MTTRALPILFASCCLGVFPAWRSTVPQVVFRSTVDVVALDVSVTAGNRPVAGLGAADFQVTDNGIKQKILSVSHDALPIDVTFVIDTSDSVAGPLLNALIKGVETVRTQLRPADRVAVVTFSQRVRERLSLVPPESAGGLSIGPASGMTSLYDATIVALAAPRIADRRQMAIVFTDGDDTMSFLAGPRVVDAAAHSSTAVFAVSTFGAATVPGGFLDRIAETTGGIVQAVPPPAGRSAATTAGERVTTVNGAAGYQGAGAFTTNELRETGIQIDAPFLRALEEFRLSYVVRYQIEGVPREGWHEVSVKVIKPGRYTVRTRKGYAGG